MLNIYEGTLGLFFDKDKLEHELRNLLSISGDTLQYEFQDGNTGLVIITGKNENEKKILPFEHPFIFTGLSKRQYVAIDLRAFMKSNIENIVTIAEGLNDRYNGELQLRRLIYTRMMLDGEYGWLRPIRNNLVDVFSIIIRQLTNIITFDKSLAEKAELIAKIHFVTVNEENKITLDNVIDRLPQKTQQSLHNGALKHDYEMLQKLYTLNKLILPSRTIGSLVNNIKALSNTERANALTTDIYSQILSRSFYSFDSSSLGIAMVENIPTFLSIYIAVVKEGINSKSTFRKIINSYKTVLKPKDTVDLLIKAYKENVIS